MKKIFKLLAISVFAIAVISCSKMKAPAASDQQPESSAAASAFTSDVGDNITGTSINTTSTGQKICAPCKQSYYFAFDQDIVHQGDIRSIQMQANYLIAHPKAKIRLEGNTDERGSKEYNVALGWRRAKAVATMLRQDGVPARQIVTISYGEEKPVALGHDEDSWHQNRRVDLMYTAK
jgi:peptidoglycan-associated lipoprotein